MKVSQTQRSRDPNFGNFLDSQTDDDDENDTHRLLSECRNMLQRNNGRGKEFAGVKK